MWGSTDSSTVRDKQIGPERERVPVENVRLPEARKGVRCSTEPCVAVQYSTVQYCTVRCDSVSRDSCWVEGSPLSWFVSASARR